MTETLIRFAISFVSILTKILYWAIFISVILSWFARGRSQLGSWLDSIVQPLCRPFRWARIGMMDLSPITALLVIDFGGRFLTELLIKLLD
ncbi:YggT family protein [bacterium]|jgi:uncharacterized protein YggT (Ycf19 family)|nr:YggT family protein [bacterium]MBT6831727.1 YggT family protein [bacterium]MBT6996550.1 YggT family protein [bacterium]MBT7772876.1 YggT family protein [bacterium]